MSYGNPSLEPQLIRAWLYSTLLVHPFFPDHFHDQCISLAPIPHVLFDLPPIETRHIHIFDTRDDAQIPPSEPFECHKQHRHGLPTPEPAHWKMYPKDHLGPIAQTFVCNHKPCPRVLQASGRISIVSKMESSGRPSRFRRREFFGLRCTSYRVAVEIARGSPPTVSRRVISWRATSQWISSSAPG